MESWISDHFIEFFFFFSLEIMSNSHPEAELPAAEAGKSQQGCVTSSMTSYLLPRGAGPLPKALPFREDEPQHSVLCPKDVLP